MEKYVWLFPLLFIFHDMEEIIGFGIWYKRNKAMLDERNVLGCWDIQLGR